ncbi:hypothetical protein P167DRAFT_576716 [Morchella conica CCBAS932]|uniref:F-box domain-containing protein n=1 Tax=Morchella conica CCBAS932 TaxID=1392247 RepID=A0A3N4KHV6_9PEZI|nr:hypothetical protein P167DRAFT_576716 [Morchella conica CCBAS932]
MSLHHLPNELLLHIADYLTPGSRSSLLAISHLLCTLLTPYSSNGPSSHPPARTVVLDPTPPPPGRIVQLSLPCPHRPYTRSPISISAGPLPRATSGIASRPLAFSLPMMGASLPKVISVSP